MICVHHPIRITLSGKTIGFTIAKRILKGLMLDHGDLIEIEIFKPYKGKDSFIITPEIVKRGGSLGVTLEFWFAEDVGIKEHDTYQAEFRKPKSPSI